MPQESRIRPCSRAAVMIAGRLARGVCSGSSIASIGPSPARREPRCHRLSRSRALRRAPRRCGRSAASASRTAIAAAHATRVAAEGAAEAAGGTASITSARPVTAASGRPPPSDLPLTSRSGCDVVVLDRPDGPGAPDARLHLVVDVEDAVPSSSSCSRFGKSGGIGRKPPSPCTGSSTAHATDSGSTSPLKSSFKRCDRVVRGHAAIGIRGRCAVHLGRERPEALLVRDDLRGHRHGEQRPAVERVVEDDHGRAAGRDARDLDRVLDRLGARVQEQRLLICTPTRRQLGESPTHFDVRLVHADHCALVQITIDLLVHRFDDGRERVADVGTTDPAGEVDVLTSVDVPDAGSFGAVDEDRLGRDPASDVALPRLLEAPCGCPFLQRHGKGDCIRRSREEPGGVNRAPIRWPTPAPWPSG